MFRQFRQLVSQVIPEILELSLRPTNPANGDVAVWLHDPASKREDLAVTLKESGTGIGHVLAIVYVLFNSEDPRILLIDEPQGFLHPGAIRKLIELFRTHSQHQFVIATHSPTVMSSANVQTISLVKQTGLDSSLFTLKTTDVQNLRNSLTEVGASLADLYGADEILWVEGATEEACFPMIAQKLVPDRQLAGVIMKGVINPGDFDGRFGEIILRIYETLSKASKLLLPVVGFLFDDEGRTEQQKKELQHRGEQIGCPVKFTKRRMYENYLLNPKAISGVIASIHGFSDHSITDVEVQKWLDDHGKDIKYGSPLKDHSSKPWIEYIHGARLLDDLFMSLSGTCTQYIKTTHSVMLTRWMIANAPEDLDEVAQLIRQFLDTKHTLS